LRLEGENVFGDEDDLLKIIDTLGRQTLKIKLVSLAMSGQPNTITKNFIEMISLMGKSNVNTEWPDLVP